MTDNKKQELIEQIAKMLQPYDDIDAYTFAITLHKKTGEYSSDVIRLSFNDYPATCYPNTHI